MAVVGEVFADQADQQWLQVTAELARSRALVIIRRRRRAAVAALGLHGAIVVACLVVTAVITAVNR